MFTSFTSISDKNQVTLQNDRDHLHYYLPKGVGNWVKNKRFNMYINLAILLLIVIFLYRFREYIDPILASYLSVAGTVFLGLVAITLNERLLKVEEDSFLSAHTCSGFIKEISIFDNARNFTSLDDRPEQVVRSKTVVDNPTGYKGLFLRVRRSEERRVG